MQLKTAITDEKAKFIIDKVKEITRRFDNKATIILFGSRARGDWHQESDWDFLVLTDQANTKETSDNIRSEVLTAIELVTFDTIFILVKNRSEWEAAYAVTPLYYNIAEEGIKV